MKTLWKYIRPHRLAILLGLLIKFAGSVVELFLPAILANIIDTAEDVSTVLFWGGLMLACSVAALLGNVIANRYSAVTAGRITRKLRHDLFARILNLSAKQTDRFTVSSLISRLTSDTYQVNNFIMRIQRIGVRAPILLLGGIGITLTMNWRMTLVLVALLPFIALFTWLITRRGVPLYRDQQSRLDDVVGVVQENAAGVRVIKALSKTEHERERFHRANHTLSATEQKAGVVMGLSGPVNSLILNLGLCAVLVVAGFLMNSGATSAGTITAFLSYFVIILNAMTAITRIFVMVSRGVASADRISEVLNEGNDLPLLSLAAEETPYHISFEDVSFSYNKIKPNLSHLSFRLLPGQTLGIIGAIGSGKTTLISLLYRFYDVDAGSIRIHGEDVRSIPTERLHTMFGAAFQNDFLRMGTVAENIDFDRGLSTEELEKAAIAAMAEEFIAEKEGGMEHPLTLRGANLSGGQKQRLLIARALAGNPEILILDDSSSALDYKTDSRLRRNLRENYRDVTTVIVAQRVSSIRHADLILVLSEGEVIGQGTHEDLLQCCEEYRRIAESQMGGGHNAG